MDIVRMIGRGMRTLSAPVRRGRRSVRALAKTTRRRGEAMLHQAQGRWTGFAYRIGGATPDLMAGDDVIADRVRSSLGQLLAWRDLPHPNVMVHDGMVTLHGVVGNAADEVALSRAVLRVAGVRGVRSELHEGFGPGDTRPSAGRHHESSIGLAMLRKAAEAAGSQAQGLAAVTLSVFLSRLPLGERGHVIGHLPADVRDLLDAEVRSGELIDVRTTEELFEEIVRRVPDASMAEVRRLAPRVIEVLRAFVPEEAADVRAVLPQGLRQLWAPVQIG